MMTVPQELQLPQITHCCPGIGPQGEGVQKVITGVQGTHMKEVVEGGRKEVSACIGRKEVEEAWSAWELLGMKMGRSPVEVPTLQKNLNLTCEPARVLGPGVSLILLINPCKFYKGKIVPKNEAHFRRIGQKLAMCLLQKLWLRVVFFSTGSQLKLDEGLPLESCSWMLDERFLCFEISARKKKYKCGLPNFFGNNNLVFCIFLCIFLPRILDV